MPITVKIVGYAKHLFDRPEYRFEHKPGLTMKEVFVRLSDRAGPDFSNAIYDVKDGLMNENIVVFVNSREIRSLCGTATVLQDGDVITIMPPMAGG